MYKVAVASNYMFDAVRFDSQKFNWNLKEFDRYSSAFAFGLVEGGYTPGDKIVLWLDQENSAEILTAQMGAAKAGVTCVTFNEKDDMDALHQTLKDSGARGFYFSPSTPIDEDVTRKTYLQKLMPELEKLYPGDPIKLSNYPHLKSIVQSGHSNIRGTIKFKDSLVYANTKYSTFSLPQNDSAHLMFECYRDGKRVSNYSSGEIAEKSSQLWQDHFSKNSGDTTDDSLFNVEVTGGQAAKPVFMSLDLETPLGFASFLSNAANHRKVFIPSSYNMSQILKSVHRQASHDLVCDKDFFELEAPGPVAAEYKQKCAEVKSVIVAGQGSAKSTIFDASATVIDPLVL